MTSETDEALLSAAISGSEHAFAALYQRHYPKVFRFARGMCGSSALAEEITQEVFVSVIGKLKLYDSMRGTFGAFLLGIARNHAFRQLRRERNFQQLQEDSGFSYSATDEIEREQLRRAILQLPEAYREAILLVELEELEYRQAAAIIGCPVGTVRSRVHRAKSMLMERLAVTAIRGSK